MRQFFVLLVGALGLLLLGARAPELDTNDAPYAQTMAILAEAPDVPVFGEPASLSAIAPARVLALESFAGGIAPERAAALDHRADAMPEVDDELCEVLHEWTPTPIAGCHAAADEEASLATLHLRARHAAMSRPWWRSLRHGRTLDGWRI